MTTHTTKDSRSFIVRNAVEDDAERIIDYSKKVFASTDQVLTTLEEYTINVDEEKQWINNFTRDQNALLLVAEMHEQIIGLLFFAPGSKKKNAHAGEFGINIHPDYQRLGIGRILVETLLKWARSNSQIKKVFLTVLVTNTNAIRLYQHLGFTEEGRHIKAVKQPNGEYVDTLQMYIET